MTQTRLAAIGDLPLRLGGTLHAAELAYVTYGTLAPDGRNAVLLTHGYTSSHLFADGGGASEGTWAELVGPGRPIDTDRCFVVSSNMLGSSYGSTAPRSINPATGRPYGPDFPALTVADIVAAQLRLLEQLGVRHLIAVVGPSYGGVQAFTWGVEYPDFMTGLVPVVTGIRSPDTGTVERLRARFSADPNWNGGHYYDKGGITGTMTALREETLRNYGIEAQLAGRFADPAALAAEVTRQARAWAEEFDANSMLALGAASRLYDVSADLARIKARVLYVLSRTDKVFPPSLAPGVMAGLHAAGVRADYFEIDSDHGHSASGTEAAKWVPALRSFMQELG
jgi:homoserine O-acetyltransferase